ncbi:MAG: hypothetical protein ACKVS6_05160 [Planctomycetota bacterium]
MAAFVAASFVPQDPPAPSDRDSVVLKSGGVVDGWIVEENDSIVNIEISPGARIELSKPDIAKITRAPRPQRNAGVTNTASAPARPNQNFEFHESWWILQNARGEYVGSRHYTSGADTRDPSLLRLEETLEIRDDGGERVRVSRIEWADAAGRPRECYYSEVFDGGASHVTAKVKDSTLEVGSVDASGSAKETLQFPENATFPLLFMRSIANGEMKDKKTVHTEVYDPFIRTFILKTAGDAGTQSLAIGNQSPVHYQVYTIANRGIESRVWLGRFGEIVRYELNGPDLAGVRATSEELNLAKNQISDSTWIARDTSGKIKVLLPGADWRVDRAAVDAVSFEKKDGTAQAVASSFILESDATTSSAAHDLERRLRSTLEKYKRSGSFDFAQIGKHHSTRFEFEFASARGLRSGIAVATKVKGRAFAIVLTFDSNYRKQIDRELDRILNRADVGF